MTKNKKAMETDLSTIIIVVALVIVLSLAVPYYIEGMTSESEGGPTGYGSSSEYVEERVVYAPIAIGDDVVVIQ